MFNDKYGLTQAVLEGRKTMTRRTVPDGTPLGNWAETENKSRYKVGDVVAVAQRYEDVYDEMLSTWKDSLEQCRPILSKSESDGWDNKMFVQADLMPHQIRITNVSIERLQDISDEDCLREGIIEDAPGVQYSFHTTIGYCGQYPFNSPRSAFAALIDKVSGKGTWESNPYVFVYEFELIK